MKQLIIFFTIVLISFIGINNLYSQSCLTASYDFFGNALDSSNGLNGIVYGAALTSDRFGNSDAAYDFDGNDNYIDINSTISSLKDNEKGAISIWVKYPQQKTGSGDNGSHRFISFSDSGDVQSFFDLYAVENGRIAFGVFENDKAELYFLTQTGIRYDDDKWHNIIVNVGQNHNALYIDGQEITNLNYIAGSNTTQRWFNTVLNIDAASIGKRNWERNKFYFDGIIDDIIIYSCDLTDSQIDSIYNSKNPIIDTNCVVANYSYTIDTNSNTVTFTNLSKGSVNSWFWEMDDGSFYFSKNVTHTYTESNLFDVSLTISDTNKNCIDKIQQRIKIGTTDCNAEFTTIIDSTNLIVQFQNKLLTSSSKLYWEFGDGYISEKYNPKHIYNKSGSYYVSLVSHDTSSNCINYYSEIIIVGSIGNKCKANFIHLQSANDYSVRFRNQSKGNNLNKYIWDFGDGNRKIEENPVHVYDESGFYNVCLTIIDSISRCKNTKCKNLNAKGNDNKCHAYFIYSVDSANKSVILKNLSKGNIDSYLWSFGDSKNSTETNPTHTYASNGYYSINLKLKNIKKTCRSFYTDIINIGMDNQGIKAIFSFESDSTYYKKGNYPVEFVGASFGDPGSFSWDFGDGTTDSLTLFPIHNYSSPGAYYVCFNVSDPATESEDSFCDRIQVASTSTNINSSISNNVLKFEIYPNPAKEMFIINMKYNSVKSSVINISLHSIHNKMIFSKEIKVENEYLNETINTTNYASGIYFLKIQTENKIQTKKIIIQ